MGLAVLQGRCLEVGDRDRSWAWFAALTDDTNGGPKPRPPWGCADADVSNLGSIHVELATGAVDREL